MKFIFVIFMLLYFTFSAFPVKADESEFNKAKMSLENFITCELTRTGATDHFDKKPFTIKMISLFEVQIESDLKIITGAVRCLVDDNYLTLYIAVGIAKTLEKEQVAYYTIRNKDFSILSTELMQYPYKEKCGWSQYWIDIN